MVISALLFVPLNDMLGVLQSLPNIFIPGEWAAQAPATTSWGTAPWPLYLAFLDAVLVVSYSTVFFYLRAPAAALDQTGPSGPQARMAMFLMTLAAGGLLARFLQSVIFGVVWLPITLPAVEGGRGVAGFLLGWALAMLLLIVAVTVMNSRLWGDDEEEAAD